MFKDLIGSYRRDVAYVATGNGIFTDTGTWYSASEESLQRYAGQVLEVRPLPRLLADADLWLRSPQTLAVWSFAAFLFVLPPVAALLASLTVFLGWQVVGPSFVHLSLLPIFRVMDAVLLQGLVYVIVLSIFASNGVFSVVWIGVAGFILYRWGIAGRLLAPLLRRLQASLYDLPLPDQVLRGMILRTALRNDISLPQIQIIERRIRQKWK